MTELEEKLISGINQIKEIADNLCKETENPILTKLVKSFLHASSKENWSCIISEFVPDIVQFKIVYCIKDARYDFIDISIHNRKKVYIAGIYICEAAKLKGFISDKYINYD